MKTSDIDSTLSTAVHTTPIPSILAITPAPDQIVVTCYAEHIPDFVEVELPRLYNNLFSSLAHFRSYGGITPDTSTYVARNGDRIVAIFLFRLEKGEVQVINEGMWLDAIEITRFANYIFTAMPSATAISFNAVRLHIDTLPFPYQRYDCTAYTAIPLPASTDAYLAGLGKNMRRNIRRYMNKLMADFPSFRFEVVERDAINEWQVRAIIELNRARIAGKQLPYMLDGEIDKVIHCTRECGLVGVATIDDRVCGGLVGFHIGETYFAKVIAHDPRYNDYSAGILCAYAMIDACIARGCKEFNWMWNEYEYKIALGAKRHELAHLTLYRSRAHMLSNGRTALRNTVNRYRHRASWLLEHGDKHDDLDLSSRMALRTLQLMRDVKRRLKH